MGRGRYASMEAKAVVEALTKAAADAIRPEHVVPVIVRISPDRCTVAVEIHAPGAAVRVSTLHHSDGISRIELHEFGAAAISRHYGGGGAAWMYVGTEVHYRPRRGSAFVCAVELQPGPASSHRPDDCALCTAEREQRQAVQR